MTSTVDCSWCGSGRRRRPRRSRPRLEQARPPIRMTSIVELERLAGAWVAAHDGDAAALARLNAHYERDFTAGDVRAEIWRRVYAYRQRSSRVPRNLLEPDEA